MPLWPLGKQLVGVVGLQWGDEGKGKFVDVLAAEADICCRYNGGSNAGHSLVIEGKRYALHLVPCGILYPHTVNLIGNGTVIHIKTLLQEMDKLKSVVPDAYKRVVISSRAHIVFDFHQFIDACQERERSEERQLIIGTTCKGIGPAYTSKMSRQGVRFCDLLDQKVFIKKYTNLLSDWKKRFPHLDFDPKEELEAHRHYAEILKPLIVDSVAFLHEQWGIGKRILAEGANATLLDIDFGTYPYVTSSSTTVAGLFGGLGLPSTLPHELFGVVKAYATRVGEGPFPTELKDEIGERLCEQGREYGTTTGRKRRCGWLDVPSLIYAKAINGITGMNLTKLDVLTGIEPLKICTEYTDSTTGKTYGPIELPCNPEAYETCTPVYRTLKGWTQNIRKCKSFMDLPREARDYVTCIEDLTGVKVVCIGLGPDRLDTIWR